MVRPVIRVAPYADEAGGGPGQLSFDSLRAASGGRLTMAKVPSLVFDMDMDHDAAAHGARDPLDDTAGTDTVQRLQQLLSPWSELEHMLLLHVQFAREQGARLGAPPSVADLADTLRRLGYGVKILTALGGGGGGACLRNLRHAYLVVTLQGPAGFHSQCVVDPRFREQFQIAHATPRYQRVLEAVTEEVVVSQDRLRRVVELLCAELARAFQETGTPLPPWRQQAAMLSKWQPHWSGEMVVQTQLSATGRNNACGLTRPGRTPPLSSFGQLAVAGGAPTVAEKLAKLGMPPASQPSPISEGLEDDDSVSEVSLDLDLACCNSEDSLHLGGANNWSAESPPARSRPQHGSPVAQPQAGSGGHRTPQLKHIWEDMRAATAALPTRRNTWA